MRSVIFGRVNWFWFTCLSLQTLIWKLRSVLPWSTCYNWFCYLMHFLRTLGRHAVQGIKEQILLWYLPCEAPDGWEWINRWGETSFLLWLFICGGGVSLCPSCGNGGGHCCPEKGVPIAPFPVLVTLGYCSLSMTQQTSLVRVQGFWADFSTQCCVLLGLKS